MIHVGAMAIETFNQITYCLIIICEVINDIDNGVGNSYSSLQCWVFVFSLSLIFCSFLVESHKACLLAVGHCQASILFDVGSQRQTDNLCSTNNSNMCLINNCNITRFILSIVSFSSIMFQCNKFDVVVVEMDDFVIVTVAGDNFGLTTIRHENFGQIDEFDSNHVEDIIVDTTDCALFVGGITASI